MADEATMRQAAEAFEKKLEGSMLEVTRAIMPLQRQSFACSDACFAENGMRGSDAAKLQLSDVRNIENCLQKCQAPSVKYNDTLSSEMHALQAGINQCQTTCTRSFGASGNEDPGAAKSMSDCIAKCFTDADPAVDSMTRRLLDLARTHALAG